MLYGQIDHRKGHATSSLLFLYVSKICLQRVLTWLPLCFLCSVAEVMEGVHQDYVKRSAYISYLVKSHQKFQDAKLQVAAVQTAISR